MVPEKTSVKLPELPKGNDFEDLVSAIFHSGDYYVEKNVICKEDGEEILELDIATTRYSKDQLPDINLIEIKSGDWGFPDIFKLRGWLDYLNLGNGRLLVNKPKDNFDIIKSKSEKLGILIHKIEDISKATESLSSIIDSSRTDFVDIAAWRFSYWVERSLIKFLKREKKNKRTVKCYSRLDEYLYKINSDIFFTENIPRKLYELYSTFLSFPNISARCGNELEGKSFDEGYEKIPDAIFRETFYECKLTLLQVSSYIEHRARLSILKSGIDYMMFLKYGGGEVVDDEIAFGGNKISIFDLMPEYFLEGLKTISENENFYRYPLFWQWFMWIFGGFILNDRKDQEYELLSKKTGIPVEEIPRAFEAYQILFPHPGGWFKDISNGNVKALQIFPVPFRGIGVHYRVNHTEDRKFENMAFRGIYTRKDLAKWNNLMVDILRTNSQPTQLPQK